MGRSFAPWARYRATTSHGVALMAAVEAMKNARTTVLSTKITFVRPSDYGEPDVDGGDQRDHEGMDGGGFEPPERHGHGGLGHADGDTPAERSGRRRRVPPRKEMLPSCVEQPGRRRRPRVASSRRPRPSPLGTRPFSGGAAVTACWSRSSPWSSELVASLDEAVGVEEQDVAGSERDRGHRPRQVRRPNTEGWPGRTASTKTAGRPGLAARIGGGWPARAMSA